MRGLPLMLVTWIALLLSASLSRGEAANVVAIAGRPFGIGRISLPLSPEGENLIVETNGYAIEEANGRVFYPTFSQRRALGLVRDMMGVQSK